MYYPSYRNSSWDNTKTKKNNTFILVYKYTYIIETNKNIYHIKTKKRKKNIK